ncbi:Uncharacterised protein [uncultured archaeon]|nr:Uncharacterised protein [uncultured archaeon]
MAMSGNELVKLTTEEIERLFSPACGLCDQPINLSDPHPPEIYLGQEVHSDCYFEKLSNELEKYPMGRTHIIPRR